MKVVVNSCFGGFGLSHPAVLAIAERKGIVLYPAVDEISERHFGPLTDDTANDYRGLIHYYKVPRDKYRECSEKWYAEDGDYKRINAQDWYFSERDIERTDPDLIAVVEEMGDAAAGRHAKLVVVEVPDDAEWEIAEYDGLEHVAERHRVWS